jgi:outer membrane murein-binding lipoprotein Lpp
MFAPRNMAVIAMACGIPLAAHAQSTAELDEIRQQIQELKSTYEKQIKDLENRLKDAEAAAAKAQASAAQAEVAAAKAEQSSQTPRAQLQPPAPGKQSSPGLFNPGISLILNGAYGNFKQDPSQYALTGFQGPGALSPGERGFQLGESELFIQSNIDHLFLGTAIFSFGPEGVEVEEAHFQTLGLGKGLTVKGGRFFSGIGYQNAIHPHAWDFFDPSLVQRAFLGNNYSDDGVQVSWIAPLPVFVELGAEFGRGKSLPGNFAGSNELADNDRNKNGVGATAFFARVGGDVGDSHSYRVGLSHLRTSTASNAFPLADFDTRTGVTNTFTNGDIRLYGADFVWKWAPQGNYQYRNVKIVAEYFQLRRDGDLTYDSGGPGELTDRFKLRQSGWYAQGVYQFRPYWRVGLRYDQMNAGSFDGGANTASIPGTDYTPRRYAAMIDWSPSEFSRVRLQYNQDRSLKDFEDDQLFLQYIFSLGTHGAHQF